MSRNDLIEKLYKCPQIDQIICNLTPPHLVGDLKQELFIELLNTDKDKLKDLCEKNEINYYCIRIILNMQGKNGRFSKKYIPNYNKLNEYVRVSISDTLPVFDLTKLNPAIKYLKVKENSKEASEAHEFIIFSHYVDLRSCEKVAKYFEINKMHVYSIVTKMKQELKTIIKNA